MSLDNICQHVEYITNLSGNQIPNLEATELDTIVSDLMSTIKSMEKLDRLSIRRTCWDKFPDANTRQIIDLCFPAQLGPLSVWPPLTKRTILNKTVVSEQKVQKKLQKPIITQSKNEQVISTQYSNAEIMLKLDALSEKVDKVYDVLDLFVRRYNGNKYSDS